MAKAPHVRPGWLAVLGVSAYRTAFAVRAAADEPQEVSRGATRLWVLPNPSGLNASWTMPKLVAAFAELRRAVEVDDQGRNDR